MKNNSRIIAILSLLVSFITLITITMYFFFDFSFKYIILLLGVSQLLGGFNQLNLYKQLEEEKGKLNRIFGVFMIVAGVVLLLGALVF